MRPPSDRELRLLLTRLSRKLPARVKLLESENPRNIKLGLERVRRAVPSDQPWRGVHVAGTNGKGSICAYLAGLFSIAGLSYGRFTSPAFPEKRHGVVINGGAVRAAVYDAEIERAVRQYKKVQKGFAVTSGQDPGDLTPFEIETAAAFRIFKMFNVRYGIVEVGMGGKTDATNVMQNKAITVISKIGMDHAEFLGNTIRDIAAMKAGIMVRGVPCVVDDTNDPSVMEVLSRHASDTGSPLIMSSAGSDLIQSLDKDRWRLEDWQLQNLLCAATAFRTVFPDAPLDLNQLMETRPVLPGRMETVNISAKTPSDSGATALVDGAHNPLALEKLAQHVDSNLRKADSPVTWVLGFSRSASKPFEEMLQLIIRPHDKVAFVEYDQRENEPPPVEAAAGRHWLLDYFNETDTEQLASSHLSLEDAVEWARLKSAGGPIVITGSLYLIRDILKLPQVTSESPSLRDSPIGGAVYNAMRERLRKGETLTEEEMTQFNEAERTRFGDEARAQRRQRQKDRPYLIEAVTGNGSVGETAVAGQSAKQTSDSPQSATKSRTEVQKEERRPADPATISQRLQSAPQAKEKAPNAEHLESQSASSSEEDSKSSRPARRWTPTFLKTPFARDPDSPANSVNNPASPRRRGKATKTTT